MGEYYVYVYRDTSEHHKPFYVGMRKGHPGKNLSLGQHNLQVRARIIEIRRKGFEPWFDPIKVITKEKAIALTRQLITMFGCLDSNTGTLLNSSRLTAQSNQFIEGREDSEQTKAKKSESAKSRVFSDEAKANMVAAAKERVAKQGISNLFKPGRVVSAEERAKLSALHKGKKVSDETRAKMSAASKGKPKSDEHRAKMVATWRRKRLQKQIDEMEIIF